MIPKWIFWAFAGLVALVLIILFVGRFLSMTNIDEDEDDNGSGPSLGLP